MDTITKAVVAAAGVLVWKSKVTLHSVLRSAAMWSVVEYIALRSTCIDLLEREYSGIHGVLTCQLQLVY